jgi:apolipoprotein N-acyltransferase
MPTSTSRFAPYTPTTPSSARAAHGDPAAPASAPPTRTAWAWLALGALLLPFTMLQTLVPAAGWLAAVLVLRFARLTPRAALALPVVWATHTLAILVALRADWLPLPLGVRLGMAAGWGLMWTMPYAADRVAALRIAPRFGMLAASLAFPAARVAGEWIMAQTPAGTWGALAFTQGGNLPLLQLAAVTGMWGVTFLVTWLAPVANTLWARGTADVAARRVGLAFAGALAAVLVAGGARLALAPVARATARVAAIVPDRALHTAAAGGPIPGPEFFEPSRRFALRATMHPVLDDLLARTEREAVAGARLVTWSEGAVVLPKEDEAAVLDRARAIARRTGAYLHLAFAVVLPAERPPFYENRAFLVSPAGEVLWRYDKTKGAPGTELTIMRRGDGVVPVARTPLGTLAAVICFDADYPAYVRQAGRAGVGILMVPANDNVPMREGHAAMAAFRAIENGTSVLRPSSYGILAAMDGYGRTLARVDHHAERAAVLRASLPTVSMPTVYARVGDLFAYLCVAGAGLVGVLAVRGRGAERT